MNEQEHEEFIEECSQYIPESYDSDAAMEAIIIQYLKDMSEFAGTIAKIISPWR